MKIPYYRVPGVGSGFYARFLAVDWLRKLSGDAGRRKPASRRSDERIEAIGADAGASHFWLSKLQAAWKRRSVVWLSGVRRAGKTVLTQSLPDTEYFDWRF